MCVFRICADSQVAGSKLTLYITNDGGVTTEGTPGQVGGAPATNSNCGGVQFSASVAANSLTAVVMDSGGSSQSFILQVDNTGQCQFADDESM